MQQKTDLARILREWGFPSDQDLPDSLKAQAIQVADNVGKRSGDLVVGLNLADKAWIEAVMATKPATDKTPVLEYLAQNKDEIKEKLSFLLCLLNAHPYLDVATLRQTKTWEWSDDEKTVVFDEAAYFLKWTAVLRNMDISPRDGASKSPVRRPYLIFADFNQLMEFSKQGREEQLQDPLRRRLGQLKLHLAVGDTKEVFDLLHKDTATDRETNQPEYTGYFLKSSATTEALQLLARILDTGLLEKVTDLDLAFTRDAGARASFRKNGDLLVPPQFRDLDANLFLEIKAFLLTKSGAITDGSRLLREADGQFTYKSDSQEVDLRCNFIPLNKNGGSDLEYTSIALRFIPKTMRGVDIRKLGIHPTCMKELDRTIDLDQGLILVVGPTGSGKSTLVKGWLGLHNDRFGETKKRLSLESPVEGEVPGVRHINVTANDGGLALFRAMLRHDPDLIFVGEVRDRETAETTVKAASSGHLVCTTLHAQDTTDSFRALKRYAGPTIYGDLVDSTILVLSQRLARRTCPHCNKGIHPLTPDELEGFEYYLNLKGITGVSAPERAVRPNHEGCKHCHKGYSGITPINEVLVVTKKVKDILLDDRVTNMRAQLEPLRSISLFESALTLVEKGIIDLNELKI